MKFRKFPNKSGTPIDITDYSHEEWISFAFDRPVAKHHTLKYMDSTKVNHSEQTEDWYRLEKWDHLIDPQVFVQNVTKLFNDRSALKRYNNDQINQGLYYIGFGAELPTCLVKDSIPLSVRINCIKSFENLYKFIFDKREISDSAYMWWNWFDGVPRNFSNKPLTKKQKIIREIMFVTLCKTLKVKSEDCQKGALHGIEHLEHPKTKKIIEIFIKGRKAKNRFIWGDAIKILTLCYRKNGKSKKILTILEKLLFDRNLFVRDYASKALCDISNERSLRTLQEAWSEPNSYITRKNIILAMVKIGDKSSIDLIKQKLSGPDPRTSILCTIALYSLNSDIQCYQSIKNLLGSSTKNQYVNPLAKFRKYSKLYNHINFKRLAIWNMGDSLNPKMIPLLIISVKDKDPETSKHAENSIKKIADSLTPNYHKNRSIHSWL